METQRNLLYLVPQTVPQPSDTSAYNYRKGRRRLQDIEIETWLEFVWKLSLLVWSWGVLIALAVIAYSQVGPALRGEEFSTYAPLSLHASSLVRQYKTAGRYDELLQELVESNRILAKAVAEGRAQS